MDEEQVSIVTDECNDLVSDCETDYSSSLPTSRFQFFAGNNGTMMLLNEREEQYRVIRNCFVNGMGEFGKGTEVVAIHKNLYAGVSGKGRVGAFRVFSEAVGKKCGGDPNIKFGWYGGSRGEISDIISHGFNNKIGGGGGGYGVGVHLSPAKFSIHSALLSDDDDNGLKHILLCRVILGKMEQISECSKQFQPSSEEFDSGVDDLAVPKRYVIWSSYMNSHILPSFVISFKTPSLTGSRRKQGYSALPKSPYMSFPNLMTALAKYLPPSDMTLIVKYHCAFKKNKITRSQLIRKLRQIAGDDLLKAVIKSSVNKQLNAGDYRPYGAAAN